MIFISVEKTPTSASDEQLQDHLRGGPFSGRDKRSAGMCRDSEGQMSAKADSNPVPSLAELDLNRTYGDIVDISKAAASTEWIL